VKVERDRFDCFNYEEFARGGGSGLLPVARKGAALSSLRVRHCPREGFLTLLSAATVENAKQNRPSEANLVLGHFVANRSEPSPLFLNMPCRCFDRALISPDYYQTRLPFPPPFTVPRHGCMLIAEFTNEAEFVTAGSGGKRRGRRGTDLQTRKVTNAPFMGEGGDSAPRMPACPCIAHVYHRVRR